MEASSWSALEEQTSLHLRWAESNTLRRLSAELTWTVPGRGQTGGREKNIVGEMLARPQDWLTVDRMKCELWNNSPVMLTIVQSCIFCPAQICNYEEYMTTTVLLHTWQLSVMNVQPDKCFHTCFLKNFKFNIYKRLLMQQGYLCSVRV